MNTEGLARDPQGRYRRTRRKLVGATLVFLLLCVATALVEHSTVITVVVAVIGVGTVVVIRKVLQIEKRGSDQSPEEISG
jgi:hypothetical protein